MISNIFYIAFDLGRNGRVKRQLTKEKLLKHIRDGLNMSEIARIYGVSITTVARYLKKYGIKKEVKNEK